MKLKPTQMKVLSVLVENKKRYLGKEEIYRLSRVNRNHIDSAIYFFLENDFIYQPTYDGKVKVTLDGIEVYEENLFE